MNHRANFGRCRDGHYRVTIFVVMVLLAILPPSALGGDPPQQPGAVGLSQGVSEPAVQLAKGIPQGRQ
jgi:hypothetical protein